MRQRVRTRRALGAGCAGRRCRQSLKSVLPLLPVHRVSTSRAAARTINVLASRAALASAIAHTLPVTARQSVHKCAQAVAHVLRVIGMTPYVRPRQNNGAAGWTRGTRAQNTKPPPAYTAAPQCPRHAAPQRSPHGDAAAPAQPHMPAHCCQCGCGQTRRRQHSREQALLTSPATRCMQHAELLSSLLRVRKPKEKSSLKEKKNVKKKKCWWGREHSAQRRGGLRAR